MQGMRDRIRGRLSYANVMVTLLGFAVLGGGAYAASQIGPDDIARNAVRSKHIKAGNVKIPDLGFIPAARYTDPRASNCDAVSVESGTSPIFWTQALFNLGGVKGISPCPSGSPRSGLVAPRDGVYQIDAGVQWPVDSTGSYRKIGIEISGDEFASDMIPPVDFASQSISTLVELGKGEAVKLVVEGDPTTPLELPGDGRTYLAFHWVGPVHVGPVD
jgi:hypothetical protein